MLYVLHGTDAARMKGKLRALLDSLARKKKDAPILRMTNEDADPSRIDELIYCQGLFTNKCIVVLDRVFSNKDVRNLLLDRIKEIAESPNVFIICEETIDKTTLLKIEKHAEKVQHFETHNGIAPEKPFNVFSLCDALGARDRRTLWTLYMRAKRHAFSDEEIHHRLFWQVKTMLLAKCAQTAIEAGLKPFVFGKASRFGKNYSTDELSRLSAQLVRLSHDARRGMHDIGVELELFILAV